MKDKIENRIATLKQLTGITYSYTETEKHSDWNDDCEYIFYADGLQVTTFEYLTDISIILNIIIDAVKASK